MIVFVHGLWLTGIESAWLRRQLSYELNCDACAFHYHSVSHTVAEAVSSLHDFILAKNAGEIHLVAHSLGGIVVLRLLETFKDIPPGRVVLLGSPVGGSRVAQGLVRWPLGPAALGRMVAEELLEAPQRQWDRSRELGVLAGTQSLGLGRIVTQLPHPNDGTVAVVETRLEGAHDSIEVPVSHTGMLFSKETARQAGHFLKHGRFLR